MSLGRLDALGKLSVTPIMRPGNRDVGEEVMGSNLMSKVVLLDDFLWGSFQ